MSDRTVTRTIETDVEPDAIFEVLSMPQLIPRWAPVFADSVEPAAQGEWQVTKDGNAFSIQVAAAQASRTVDYLREIAPGKQAGAYIRVIPRPKGGSVVVMTLPIPADGDAEKVTEVLTQELKALVNLSEARATAR